MTRSFVVLAEMKANPFAKKGKRMPGDPGYKPDKAEGEDWEGTNEFGDPADPTETGEGLDEAGGEPMPDGLEPADMDERAEQATANEVADPSGVDPEAVDGDADPFDDPVDPEADITEPGDELDHAWAGDVVEDLDTVTEPEASFRAFAGPAGEQAWLDRADDGTLTGWVQTPDGQTYRYLDADAWAIDVDDAGMSVSGGAIAPEGEEPAAPPMPQATPPGMPPQMQGKALLRVARLRG